MRSVNHCWSYPLLAALLVVSACAEGYIDEPDSASVVLEIQSVTAQPVTAAPQGQGVCTGDNTTPCTNDAACQFVGGFCFGVTCVRLVPDWNWTATALPVSSVATTQPFNNIILESVTVIYDGPLAGAPPNEVGLADIAIPVGGSNSFAFSPVTFESLSLIPPFSQGTSNLTFTFHARTEQNDPIHVVAQKQLFVQACF